MSSRVGILLCGLAVACPVLSSQTLTVRVLNAKSGKPFGGRKVTAKWDVEFRSSEISIGGDGVGRLQVPSNAKEFILITGPRSGREPFRIAYLNCNKQASTLISVAVVLERGVVPENACGHPTAVARAGEVIFWALPLPSGKPDFQ